MVEKSNAPQHVSAGGVVYRRADAGIEVVLCRRDGEPWKLPKGSPEPGETLEHTAVREVQEETGLRVAIERRLGSIRYQFTGADGNSHDKRVEHHLMVPLGGSLDHHDHEFDEVGWFPAGEALRLLGFPNEQGVLQRALRVLEGELPR